MWWGMHSPDKFFSRALAVFIAFGIVGVGLVEGLRLASRREAHHEQAQIGNNSAESAAQANINKESQPIKSTIDAQPSKEPKHHSSISAAMSPTPLSSHVSLSAPVLPVPSGPAKTPSVARVVEQDPHRRVVFKRLYYQSIGLNGVHPTNEYMEQRLEGLGEHFGYSGEDYGQDDLPNDKDAAYQLVDENLFKKRLAEFKGTSISIGYAPERWLLAKQIHEGLLSDEWKAQKRQITDPEALPKTNMVLIRMPKTISAPQRNAVRALLAELVKNGIQINTEYVENGQLQVLIPANVRVGIAASPADYLKADETFFRLQNWPLPGSKEAQFMQAVFGDTSNLDTPKKAYLYWIANRGGIAGDLREARESFGGFLGVTKADPIVSYGTMTQNAERDLVYEGKYVFRDAATNQIKLTPIFQQKLDSVRPKPQ